MLELFTLNGAHNLNRIKYRFTQSVFVQKNFLSFQEKMIAQDKGHNLVLIYFFIIIMMMTINSRFGNIRQLFDEQERCCVFLGCTFLCRQMIPICFLTQKEISLKKNSNY